MELAFFIPAVLIPPSPPPKKKWKCCAAAKKVSLKKLNFITCIGVMMHLLRYLNKFLKKALTCSISGVIHLWRPQKNWLNTDPSSPSLLPSHPHAFKIWAPVRYVVDAGYLHWYLPSSPTELPQAKNILYINCTGSLFY